MFFSLSSLQTSKSHGSSRRAVKNRSVVGFHCYRICLEDSQFLNEMRYKIQTSDTLTPLFVC